MLSTTDENDMTIQPTTNLVETTTISMEISTTLESTEKAKLMNISSPHKSTYVAAAPVDDMQAATTEQTTVYSVTRDDRRKGEVDSPQVFEKPVVIGMCKMNYHAEPLLDTLEKSIVCDKTVRVFLINLYYQFLLSGFKL